jgi:hypothetical protein
MGRFNPLQVNSTESQIIFACESNMQFMCYQQIFFVDGTFDYRENRILLTLILNTLISKH